MSEAPKNFSLTTLLIPSKNIEVDVPGHPGFAVTLCFLSREELQKIRKKCLKTKYNNRTRVVDETLDEEAFLKLYTDSTVKNWVGLSLEILEKLTLIDIEGMDKKAVLPYSQDDAHMLMKNSSEFDGFITDTVGDLTTFTKAKAKK